MKKNNLVISLPIIIASFLAGSWLLYISPAMADIPSGISANGSFYGDIRYRYENIDQAGISRNAEASTARARLGYKTGIYHDFQALVETDLVTPVGATHYNSTVNGKTLYPIIADPRTAELNQLWLSWSGNSATNIKAGRQTINLDNQRFVGSVNWRQNDQTLDAVTIENKTIKNFTLFYSYIFQINRVFGHSHPLGELDTDTHLAHVEYNIAPWLKVSGYGYWLDIDDIAALSSRTYGLRFTGDAPLDDQWSFFYEAEGAAQNNYGNNPANYNADYWHLAPGIKWDCLSLQAGFESLGGNGVNAFQTPLATLHAFNGWADKFAGSPGAGGTPVNGLEDTYIKASYKISQLAPAIDGTLLEAAYHDFDAQRGSNHYGAEWNLQISRSFKLPESAFYLKEFSVALKYANYNANILFTDTQKTWIVLGTKF